MPKLDPMEMVSVENYPIASVKDVHPGPPGVGHYLRYVGGGHKLCVC